MRTDYNRAMPNCRTFISSVGEKIEPADHAFKYKENVICDFHRITQLKLYQIEYVKAIECVKKKHFAILDQTPLEATSNASVSHGSPLPRRAFCCISPLFNLEVRRRPLPVCKSLGFDIWICPEPPTVRGVVGPPRIYNYGMNANKYKMRARRHRESGVAEPRLFERLHLPVNFPSKAQSVLVLSLRRCFVLSGFFFAFMNDKIRYVRAERRSRVPARAYLFLTRYYVQDILFSPFADSPVCVEKKFRLVQPSCVPSAGRLFLALREQFIPPSVHCGPLGPHLIKKTKKLRMNLKGKPFHSLHIEGGEMGDTVTKTYPPMRSRYATGKEYSHAATFPVETGISSGTLFCRHFCWFIHKYMRTGPGETYLFTSLLVKTDARTGALFLLLVGGAHPLLARPWELTSLKTVSQKQYRTGALFLLLILYRLLIYTVETVETVKGNEFFNLSFLGTFSPTPGLRFFSSRVIGSRYPIDYTILIRIKGKEMETSIHFIEWKWPSLIGVRIQHRVGCYCMPKPHDLGNANCAPPGVWIRLGPCFGGPSFTNRFEKMYEHGEE